jgi:gliding motility-associated protein GldC
MNTSTITIDVLLDPQKIPAEINWNASQSNSDDKQQAKAMVVAFWDGQEKAAMRIDLWTKDMMVDEMADFYYQNFMGLADAFERATHNEELVDDLKKFAKTFYNKFKDMQQKEMQKGL